MRSRRDLFIFIAIAVVITGVAVVFALITMNDVTQRLADKTNPALIGMPTDWQLNFHLPNSAFQGSLTEFHNVLLGVDLFICGFVSTLIIFAIWRFRQSKNPVPATISHNSALEITWTVVPALILVLVAIPSFKLLSGYTHFPKAGVVLRVTGHQWYWEYQYPGHPKIDVVSQILSDDELKGAQTRNRLLLVDNYAMLPAHTNVLIQITSGDVIHSFFVSSLGLQKYAVPGRTNQIWVNLDRQGVFYGQCNQLCGIDHAFMPIGIKVVSKEAFADWLKQQESKPATQLDKPALRTAALIRTPL